MKRLDETERLMGQNFTRSTIDRALPFLVAAAGIWAAIYAVAGGTWSEMGDTELSRVEGCYTLAGQQLFKITDNTLLTSDAAVGFEGRHEKGRDVIIVDRPVEIARRPRFVIVWQGTVTKIPIIYDDPVRLELWDEGNRRWEASRIDCPGPADIRS